VGFGIRVQDPLVSLYPMFLVPHLKKMQILKAELLLGGEFSLSPLAETDLNIQAGEVWIMKAGAVGPRLTLKAWRAGEDEPPTPQLTAADSTYVTGSLALGADVFPGVPGAINAKFDDLHFWSAPIQPVSPSELEIQDGNTQTPSPSGPIRVQLLFPASDFHSLPASHRQLTGFALRPDITSRRANPATTHMTVRMSTTDASELSRRFADNLREDLVVFDGDVTFLDTNAASDSKAFDYAVYFTEPFVYDPSDGNLLLDVTASGFSPGGFWTDSRSRGDARSTIIVGDPGSPVANASGPWDWPTQFLFVSSLQQYRGDFNRNGLDVSDIDLMNTVVRSGTNENRFDMTGDGKVDQLDRRFWVDHIRRTYFGDANLDGVFDSGDLVSVFQAAQYEDAIPGNSTWATGDWDGDGDFTTGDLVQSFQDGGFERGPRPAFITVPEPSLSVLLGSTLLVLMMCRRWRFLLDFRDSHR
jgi:hypothetical protein